MTRTIGVFGILEAVKSLKSVQEGSELIEHSHLSEAEKIVNERLILFYSLSHVVMRVLKIIIYDNGHLF